MLFCGLPLLCMEYAIGQLAQQGQAAFAYFCPVLKGKLQCLNFLFYSYYNRVICIHLIGLLVFSLLLLQS